MESQLPRLLRREAAASCHLRGSRVPNCDAKALTPTVRALRMRRGGSLFFIYRTHGQAPDCNGHASDDIVHLAAGIPGRGRQGTPDREGVPI